MDEDFIKKAIGARTIRLNLTPGDFQSLDYKDEIRHLFKTFGGLPLDDSMYGSGIDVNDINRSLSNLKSSPEYFNVFDGYGFPTDFGPGELMIYLLVNDAYLSGRTQSYDINTSSAKYEVKAGTLTNDKKYVYGFFTGRKISSVSKIIDDMSTLAKQTLGVVKRDLGATEFNQIKKHSPAALKQFETIENQYAQIIVKEYFTHPTLFFGSKSANSRDKGLLLGKKDRFNVSDIKIQAITQGAIKPYVKV